MSVSNQETAPYIIETRALSKLISPRIDKSKSDIQPALVGLEVMLRPSDAVERNSVPTSFDEVRWLVYSNDTEY